MKNLKITIAGTDRVYDSVDEMFEYWEKEELELKTNKYWTWLLKEILEWFEFKWDKIETFWYDLKHGFRNLKEWIPVIWKDRNWDSHYLLVIMKKKLELLEKPMNEDEIHCSAPENAKQMRFCIEHLNRIIKDEYHNHKRYKELNEATDNREEYINHTTLNKLKKRYKHNQDIQKRIRDIRYSPDFKYTEYLIEQDYKFLFKIMSKNIRNWWN